MLSEKDSQLISDVTELSQSPNDWLNHEIIHSLLDIITRIEKALETANDGLYRIWIRNESNDDFDEYVTNVDQIYSETKEELTDILEGKA